MDRFPEERLVYLLTQVRQSSATQEEFAELIGLLESDPVQGQLLDSIRDYFGRPAPAIPEADPDLPGWQELLQRVLAVDRPPQREPEIPSQPAPVVYFRRRWRWIAAASIVVLLGAGLYFRMHNSSGSSPGPQQETVDIEPGKNGALLQLADGSTVLLDSLGNGLVANQGNAEVILHNGRLSYAGATGQPGPLTASATRLYNTLTTPRGRIFQLTLSDGTKVWLNAASSLRYPATFSKGQRLVEVSGEVYFEVASDPSSPFLVSFGGRQGQPAGTVKVLGTSFNISTYPDEAASRTTLIDGAIKVSGTSGQLILKPGQQSELTRNGALAMHDKADLRDVLSWKNGSFSFDNKSLEEIMRLLSRWYDIDIVYEKGIPDIGIAGRMGRDVNLSRVLTFLQDSGLRFRLEAAGKKLIIVE